MDRRPVILAMEVQMTDHYEDAPSFRADL